jgi:ABC-type uncharacterized transport system auxiliary subunit
MKYPNRFARILLSASVCFSLGGCFSYTKEEHTAVPTVDTPAATSSSTTTTTTTAPDPNATIERQHTTTTYTTNP